MLSPIEISSTHILEDDAIYSLDSKESEDLFQDIWEESQDPTEDAVLTILTAATKATNPKKRKNLQLNANTEDPENNRLCKRAQRSGIDVRPAQAQSIPLGGTASSKTIILVGLTGVGKSRQVARYPNTPMVVGHNLGSKTTGTKGYNASIAGECIKFYDTPGLGDTEQRDQAFLDDLVRVLQDNCDGVHKFYITLSIFESRFNAYLPDCLNLLLSLAPDIKEKPCILTVMLTKADKGGEAYWGRDLNQKIDNCKNIVKECVGIPTNIIIVGDENQDQFIIDVRNTSINVFTQTKFMKNVETLATQKAQVEEALQQAKVRQDAQKMTALVTALNTANENYVKQCERTRQMVAEFTMNENAKPCRKRGTFLHRVMATVRDLE